MSRPLRIEYNNAIYHITARGNERKNIFLDKKDFEKFLYYLNVVYERYRTIVYSFALLDNHYHLLIETPYANLSKMMRDLNGHYTIYFNKRHKRNGHLFQGRFKSILVDKDNYLLALSRYIHLNPVRAGITSKPENYSNSSMSYYMCKSGIPPWLNVDFVLEPFGDNFQEKRNAYRRFVCDGSEGLDNPFKNIYAQCILGSEGFVREIVAKYLRKKNISTQVPRSKKLKYCKDLNDIAMIVTEYYGIDKTTLRVKKVRDNKGRKAFVYLARRFTDNNLNEIKSFLGNSVTEVAVSKLFGRTQEELGRNTDLRNDVKKIERILIGNSPMYHVKT